MNAETQSARRDTIGRLIPGQTGSFTGYAFALIITVIFLYIRLGLENWVADRPNLIFFIPPIIFSAYVGGLGPGLLATAVAAFGTNYFLVPPRYSFDIANGGDLAQWAILVINGVLISLLAAASRQGAESREGTTPGIAAIELQIRVGSAIALTMLLIVSALSYLSIDQLNDSAKEIAQSEATIRSMKNLNIHIKEVETGIGRFIITGTNNHIEAYRAAAAAVDADLQNLHKMMTGDPERLAHLATLAQLVQQRIAIGENMIALRKRGFVPARDAIAGGEGKRVVDRIRETIGEMEITEDAISRDRRRNADRYAEWTRITISISGLLAFILTFAGMFVIRRELAARRRADILMRAAHDTLEVRVRERTEELARSHGMLHSREQQLAGIVNSAMDAIVTVDEHQRIVLFNSAAERIFGRSRNSMMGQPLDLLIPSRFGHAHSAYIRTFDGTHVTSRQMGGAAEVAGLRANGIEFPLEASISKIDVAGIKMFTAILRDITDRKRAETALRDSESQLRLITDAMPALISYIDINKRYRFVNRTYEQWWARPRSDIVGRPVSEILGPLFREVVAHMEKSLAGQLITFESTTLYGDGQTRHISTTYIPDIDAGGKVRGLFVMATDITEQRRNEAIVQHTQKMESLGTLAGGIAHDFNNILPAIIGYAAAVERELPGNHPAQALIAEISKAGQRASDLVRRILVFSRPQEHSAQIVDIESITREGLNLLRATLPASIEVRSTFSPAMRAVRADPTQVYQIILNLLTNAAHAIGQRGGVIDLCLDSVAADTEAAGSSSGLVAGRDYAHLFVSDNGCGIDAATLTRIFDPFFTTKPVGQGTGLGLSIVHSIMKNIGGTITVSSEPGKGSRFDLYFPFIDSSGIENKVKPGRAVLGEGKRIMYVDDEEPLVFLASRLFKQLGYTITAMTNASEALREFRSRPEEFDVVVSDLSMPRMSGFDFARQVLAINPAMPVVITSGYIRPEDEQTSRDIGVRAIIEKPNTMQELAAILDRLIGKNVC